jgi:heme exporter protein C
MKSQVFYAGAAVTVCLQVYAMYQSAAVAPREATMGDAQRIFYYHAPAATASFSLFIVNCIASIFYLVKRNSRADGLAASAAEVGVVFSLVVLVTGPIWARYAWGVWWTWDARLSTTLLLWLLYMSYLILRRSTEAGSTSVLAAALAIFASLHIPVVYMSNRWFRTAHPPPLIGNGLDPAMTKVLMWNFLAFLAFAALIAWFRYDLERLAQKIDTGHLSKAARASTAMLVLPACFFMTLGKPSPATYFHAGATAA